MYLAQFLHPTLSPDWRPELAREIAFHRAVPAEAVLLMIFGIDLDLCHQPFQPFGDRFAVSSRHAAEHPGTLDPACPACRRVERVRQYLLELCTPVVLALPPEMTDYRRLRAALGRGERVVDETVRRWLAPLCARFRTDDVHEALVVALWIARRLLGITHAPGALTAGWREHFMSDRALTKRQAALRHALDDAIALRM